MPDAHLSPELIISSLRLLVEVYKLGRDKFKDKKTPDRVEEIVIRVENAPPNSVNAAEIERRITDALDPGDAAIVKGDLELLSLLMLPSPALEAFDYWGKLTVLIDGLQAYAREKRLFELRGYNRPQFGQVLQLPKTGGCILPQKHAADLCIPYQREGLKHAEGLALLRKEGQGLPIEVGVGAEFYQYSSMGGHPGVEFDSCFYHVGPGQQRHWLKFDRAQWGSAHFGRAYEYMLGASDFVAIVQALKDDISDYAIAAQADEQKIGPLFAAIDAFAKGMSR